MLDSRIFCLECTDLTWLTHHGHPGAARFARVQPRNHRLIPFWSHRWALLQQMATASPATLPAAACMCTLSISLPAAPLCALPSQIALPRCAIEIEKHDSTIADMVRSQRVTPGRVRPSPVPSHTLLKISLTPARKAQPHLAGAIIEPVILAGTLLSPYNGARSWLASLHAVVLCDVGLVLRDGPGPSRRTTPSSSLLAASHGARRRGARTLW